MRTGTVSYFSTTAKVFSQWSLADLTAFAERPTTAVITFAHWFRQGHRFPSPALLQKNFSKISSRLIIFGVTADMYHVW
jgi:hypothetical protein